jgi:hypothetical protein
MSQADSKEWSCTAFFYLGEAMPELSLTSLQDSCTPYSDTQATTATPYVLDGFLRREELARQFGLSCRTIDRWEALRIGPPRICVGRTILYQAQSVREWLVSRQPQPEPEKRRRRLASFRP